MLILLVYVLFVTDISILAGAPDSTIDPINASLILSIVVFGMEMMANSWVQEKRDYFYLSLELIGTLSILMEVTWVGGELIPSSDYRTENVSRTAIITSRAGKICLEFRLQCLYACFQPFQFKMSVDSSVDLPQDRNTMYWIDVAE